MKNVYCIEHYLSQCAYVAKTLSEKDYSLQCAREELQKMVGLVEIKKLLADILNFFQLQKIRRQEGGGIIRPCLHMVFYGNPGTAKTTVARLVGKILREEKIVEKGDFYELGRTELMGRCMRWTTGIVEEYFEQARGSVLFIDEAHGLAEELGSNGDMIINALVQEMERHREDVVVIMAGYKKQMEYLLQKNQGLRSRISFPVIFPDYSIDELYQILEQMIDMEGLELAEEVWDPFCDRILQMDIHQGNGRAVRNILDRAKLQQAGRILKLPEEKQSEEMYLLRKEDFCQSY